MKRKIISIDDSKCTGCGLCIPDCPEGAIQLIDGKARLVSDLFCDGLGACIKACPVGAMRVEEREAEPYNERRVMDNIIKGGQNVIAAHLKHLKDHNETQLLHEALEVLKEKNIDIPVYEDTPASQSNTGGCPGMQAMQLKKELLEPEADSSAPMQSELSNWPVQLRLLNPNAGYLQNADLLIAADCTAFSFGNFHRKFLKDKTLVVFCPKLDSNLDEYIDKLSSIFSTQNINSITIVRMQVPCCGGVERIVKAALEKAQTYISVKEYIVSLEGKLI